MGYGDIPGALCDRACLVPDRHFRLVRAGERSAFRGVPDTLGLPWNFLADKLGLAGVATAVLAPAINLGILFWLWKR